MARKPPDEVDRFVGNRLRMRRMMLRMSQQALGEALGLTFQQVQKYEKGVNRIGASRMHEIAGVLKTPVAFFFDGAPGGAGAPAMPSATAAALDTVQAVLATPDGIAMVQAFGAIADHGVRRRLLALTRAIAGADEAAAEAA